MEVSHEAHWARLVAGIGGAWGAKVGNVTQWWKMAGHAGGLHMGLGNGDHSTVSKYRRRAHLREMIVSEVWGMLS